MGEEVFLSYLPLSHIAAQICDIFGPIAIGGTVYFAQPDALRVSFQILYMYKKFNLKYSL